jgi:lipopolysaccharide export LptBFGC system permease protein LptF
MDRLIDPVIADMQHEHASTSGQPWKRRWVLVCGYIAFWKVLAVRVPAALAHRIVRELAISGELAPVRGLCIAAVTMFILTALLIAPPLQRDHVTVQHIHIVWQAILLLPQALPISLPIALLAGVLSGVRGHAASALVRRTVLVVGLIGSLTSFGTITVLVPAANQAYRETLARGGVIQRGFNELPVRSLRERALTDKSEGRLDRAGALLLDYHARWSLVGAALVFVVFGLGLTALRTSRTAAAGISAIACVVYVAYLFELGAVRSSVFSNEALAIGIAWLPNVMMILTSLAFLSARDATGGPDQKVI